MNVDKLKIEKLGKEERKILLSVLNIPMKNMRCAYCRNKVSYITCGIMPPIKRGEIGRITCDSPMCISEYLEDYTNIKIPKKENMQGEKE